MTREKALEVLTGELNFWSRHDPENTELKEALMVAIQALVPRPTFRGYDMDELIFVSDLLHGEKMSPEELHLLYEDAGFMYKIIESRFNDAIRKQFETIALGNMEVGK